MGFCRICKVEYGADKNLKFHRLPKDEFTKNQWIKIIGKVVPPSSVVCSRHFSENDYVVSRNGQKKTLKAGSVPELQAENSNLSSPSILSVSVMPENYSSNDNFGLLQEVKEEVQYSFVSSDNDETTGENNETKVFNQNCNLPRKRKLSLRFARYPRDLRPEHFVRKEDHYMLNAYLNKQRQAAKRVSKRISRWKKQVIQAENLLTELEERGFLSSEAADTIRSSLPNIVS